MKINERRGVYGFVTGRHAIVLKTQERRRK